MYLVQIQVYHSQFLAYMKGLPLPRLPVVVDVKERESQREQLEREEEETTPSDEDGIRLEKSNILLLGPTGSGEGSVCSVLPLFPLVL